MGDVDYRQIPAVAWRIARDELASRVVELETELGEKQAAATSLASQLSSSLDELEWHRGLQADIIARGESLKRSREVMSAEIEELRAKLDEWESAARTGEAVRIEMEARIAGLAAELSELRVHESRRSARIEELEADLIERDVAARVLDEQRAKTQRQIEDISRQLGALQEASGVRRRSDDEIATCRRLADRCIFVVGFARSNTTVTSQMLNSAGNALILGEADFFLDDHGDRFSCWFNERHRAFRNQRTKSSHAPDFLPGRPHKWWEWLESAGLVYDHVGAKVALSDFHLSKVPPEEFRRFHEARFLSSRYVFLLRDPTEVLLSTAKLLSIVDDAGMAKLFAAWLDYMQLWADFIRVFPRTLTLVCERFGESTVKDLEVFTGLHLRDAKLLIDPAKKRRHKLGDRFPTLMGLKSELVALYADAVLAVDEGGAIWQAEQKRDAAANYTNGKDLGSVAVTSRPLGRVWLRAHELRERLAATMKEVGR